MAAALLAAAAVHTSACGLGQLHLACRMHEGALVCGLRSVSGLPWATGGGEHGRDCCHR